MLGRHEQTLTSLMDQCNAISEKREELLTRFSELRESNPPVLPSQPGPLPAPAVAHPAIESAYRGISSPPLRLPRVPMRTSSRNSRLRSLTRSLRVLRLRGCWDSVRENAALQNTRLSSALLLWKRVGQTPRCGGIFLASLSEQMKDQLAVHDELATFEALASLALRIDSRLRERDAERRSKPSPSLFRPVAVSALPPSLPVTSSVRPRSPSPEPMQIGRARLTPEERERRFRAGECFYCGGSGHRLTVCPVRPKGVARR
uniref:uncharacterized protein LOC101477551 n=1 Tax=Maylandia zebra TaxID=106582 RepID=UPI00032A1670|nr:uncharacterized protein LOC101477551 [Maylandia zebra]